MSLLLLRLFPGQVTNLMTKLQHIQRQAARVQLLTIPIALLVIAFMLYVQLSGVPLPKEFWLTLYIALGCASVFFLGLMLHRARCPDCRRCVAIVARERNPVKCPYCSADWTAEMK